MTEATALLGGAGEPLGKHPLEATRRRLTPRQAEAVGALVRAAEEEVEATGYPGLTVRGVARRAGVAPATAYNYFSSKDHLLAEVLWRRTQELPTPDPVDERPVRSRVEEAVQALVFSTGSAALSDACTVALLSPNPDVKHLRDRIGAEIHRRLASALGAGADRLAVRVLETTFSGALLFAGMGHMDPAEIPDFVADAAALVVGARRPGGPPDGPGRGKDGPR